MLGGVGVAVVMGVGGADVGVGGSDSDERKQTPVLAEDDQEGSCFAALSGFSACAIECWGRQLTGPLLHACSPFQHIPHRLNPLRKIQATRAHEADL